MRQRAVQGFIHAQRLLTDDDDVIQVRITQPLERAEEGRPALLPFLEQLRARHRSLAELLLAGPPRLLAVAGQKISEARAKITRDVPADHRDRISPIRALCRQLA